MDFTFDLSQTPVIGRRFLIKPNIGGSGDEKTFSAPASVSSLGSGLCPSSGAGDGPGNTSGSSLVTGLGASPRRSVSLSPADSASIAGWKRPWMSQVNFFIKLEKVIFYMNLTIYYSIIILSY